MVLLSNILKASLSNSSNSFCLIADETQGVSGCFILEFLKNLQQNFCLLLSQHQHLWIAEELGIPIVSHHQALQGSFAVRAIPTLDKEVDIEGIPENLFVAIDSLQALGAWVGEARLQDFVYHRVQQATGVLALGSPLYIPQKTYSAYQQLASIFVKITNHYKTQGTAQCLHHRGNLKFTQELCSFWVEGKSVKAGKYKPATVEQEEPVSTFRIQRTEEEEKMRLQTPLPYEQTDKLIVVDPQDIPSEDEEGDEDIQL